MLYVSTRNRADSYTAHRVLHEKQAPDDCFFMPFRMPVYSEEETAEALNDSFNENVAKVLSTFFPVNLSGWGLECTIGKNPVSIVHAGSKIYLAELWHNFHNSYEFLEKEIYEWASGEKGVPNSWVKVAIEIGVLFGIFANIKVKKSDPVDIALDSDDFTSAIAAYLARQMGLPVGNIICCFRENSDAWNFLHHGEVNTAASIPQNLDRFIYAALGPDEANQYQAAIERKGNYKITEEQHKRISTDLFPAVVSQHRVEFLADLSHGDNAIRLDDAAAMAYGGLQDYRSKTGESHKTLILSYSKPKE